METGFPTSLIDLFVKNRDRLKKPSKKSKQNRKLQQPEAGNSRAAFYPPTDDPRVPGAAEDHANPPAFAALRDQIPEQPAEAAAGITGSPIRNAQARLAQSQAGGAQGPSVIGEIPRGEGPNGPRANRISLAVLKVFVMVVLALRTKGLVMGITISALVLLLLEHMGMEIPSFMKNRWSGRSHRDVRNSRCKRAAFIFEGTEKCHFTEEEVGDGGGDSDVVLVEGSDSDGKIKTLEPNRVVPDPKGECLGPIADPELLTQDRIRGYFDIEEETSAMQGNGNEVAKKKPKIMKRIALPMKMRNQKKGERKDSQPLVS